jgi:serine protease Do
MNKIVKLSVLFFAVMITTGHAFAQDEKNKDKDKDKKDEDVIIRKKGDSKEKLTIVIDGDKVTINGKPVDEYKSDDVDIIHGDNEFGLRGLRGLTAPRGGMQMFGDDFMREIHSNKAFLGVMTKEGDGGAEITEVTKESPAEKAGLKEGDVITKINDDKIADADDLYKAVGKYKPGEKVNITYKRNGKESTVSVELTENKQVRAYSWKSPDNDNFNFTMPPGKPYINGWKGLYGDKPRLGVQAQDTEDGKGVKVLEVEDDEAADKAGLKEDDIITQVNGKNITSVDDLKEIMKTAKNGDTLKITFLRDNKTETVDVNFPKDLKTTDL